MKEKNLFSFDEQTKEIRQLPPEEYQPQDLKELSEDIWSIQSIWNELNELSKKREPKSRDYTSFSDLGKKDYWSRYMKMTGVPETNPFEPRVLRIFSAGDEFHHLLKRVFKRTGIFIDSQDTNGKWSVIQPTEKTLKILGKYDVLAGGKPSGKINEEDFEEFSDFVKDKAKKIALFFMEKFKDGLKPMIYEFKSINSNAFWGKRNYLLDAYPWHILQLYGYLKANNIPEGRILYISKDDLTLAEFPIYYPTEKYEKLLQEDLETMSYHILNKIEPPKPPSIIFDKRKTFKFQNKKISYQVLGCYDLNWEVARSSWFTAMTGFKNTDDWEDSIKTEISAKNAEIKGRILESINKK